MDAMLEEEMVDLLTFCLQNEDKQDTEEYKQKKNRVHEIGQELNQDGGVDAMENMFFTVEQRIKDEINKDPKPLRKWWNDIDSEWNY